MPRLQEDGHCHAERLGCALYNVDWDKSTRESLAPAAMEALLVRALTTVGILSPYSPPPPPFHNVRDTVVE